MQDGKGIYTTLHVSMSGIVKVYTSVPTQELGNDRRMNKDNFSTQYMMKIFL